MLLQACYERRAEGDKKAARPVLLNYNGWQLDLARAQKRAEGLARLPGVSPQPPPRL